MMTCHLKETPGYPEVPTPTLARRLQIETSVNACDQTLVKPRCTRVRWWMMLLSWVQRETVSLFKRSNNIRCKLEIDLFKTLALRAANDFQPAANALTVLLLTCPRFIIRSILTNQQCLLTWGNHWCVKLVSSCQQTLNGSFSPMKKGLIVCHLERKKYRDVFEGTGKLPGGKCDIHLNPGDQPVQDPPRAAPEKKKAAYKGERI